MLGILAYLAVSLFECERTAVGTMLLAWLGKSQGTIAVDKPLSQSP